MQRDGLIQLTPEIADDFVTIKAMGEEAPQSALRLAP